MSEGDRNKKPIPGIAILVLLTTVFMLGTLAIWLSSDQGPQAVANTYEASKYSVNTSDRIKAACGGFEDLRLTECIVEIDQSERENHNTQKDIRAQRYMAVWGFIMAYAAIGTLGVTTVGLVWIKATLDQTREAVRAADDAVKVARDVGEKQTKATLAALDQSVEANIMQVRQFRYAHKPWIFISLAEPLIVDSGLLESQLFKDGNTEATVRLCSSIKIQNIGKIPLFIEDFKLGFDADPQWHYIEHPPDGFYGTNCDYVLRPNDSIRLCVGAEKVPGTQKNCFLARAILTREDRQHFRFNTPPITGHIIYADSTGFRYKRHFALIARPVWMSDFQRYKGRERNYEEDLD